MSKASSNFSLVKNIGNVFELSGLAFRLVPLYGGLLVLNKIFFISDVANFVPSTATYSFLSLVIFATQIRDGNYLIWVGSEPSRSGSGLAGDLCAIC